MPIRRSRAAIETPPKQFPVVIKPHVYEESGLKTCLHCGQKVNSKLHITLHFYERNMMSKLKKCMCGKPKSHHIHKKEST